MKKYIIKSIFAIALLTAFTSCTESDNGYDTAVSKEVKTYELTTTKTVADVNLAATATPTVYTADDIIEAYVTSNDAGGNFYKTLSFQDVQTGGPAPVGFAVSINQSMLFKLGFYPGRKVYIKLKGLAIAKVFGTLSIGHIDPKDATKITGIEGLELADFLFPSATIVDESTLVRHMSLAAAAVDAVQNTLIEIDNVQFADGSISRTYFDVDSGGVATNQDIVDVTGGRSRYCRISKFAPFSTGKIPTGRGSIRGVMTKYNSDYQFIVRNESDFKLTNPRTYNFAATLNENFNSYPGTTGNYSVFTSYVNFANYLNFAPVGSKKWFVKSSGGAITLQMSAFGGNAEDTKAYFMVPVDMTAASTFKLDVKINFYSNATGLKIYRTTDFVPGMKIQDATLTDITTAFNQVIPSANATLTNVTYNIPAAITGNGYFVFEYVGSNLTSGPVVTTTIDLDNVIVN